MAASKEHPPTPPRRLVTPSPSAPLGAGGKSSLPKIRAGMGDVEATAVEVWTDEDQQRATGLLAVLSGEGKVLDRAALPAIEPAAARELYRAMLRLRALDDAAQALVRDERLGAVPSTRGTEAAVVGAAAALAAEDVIAPGRRHGGAALLRGVPARTFVAQLLGNADDPARGRQPPGCASFDRARNVLPSTAHAATQLPQATGVAWAMKMQRKRAVALAFLDAAEASAEDFHSGLNFAGVYKVPVVFVGIDDRTGPAPATPETLSETLAVKALAYGLPGVRVDGGDLAAVLVATRGAVDRARRGEGATLIETLVTPGADPIERAGGWLAAEGILSAADAAAMRAEVGAEIEAALAAELAVGPPPRHRMVEDVYARPPAPLEDAVAALERLRHR